MFKILLVDDERIIMEGLEFMIRQYDPDLWEFKYAGDGTDALDLVDHYRPDVIFTDIRMENMDGLQLTEELRKKGEWGKRVPIVILSGYSEFDYAKKAIGYRVFDYLTKPIHEQSLPGLLHNLKAYLENRAGLGGGAVIGDDSDIEAIVRMLQQKQLDMGEVRRIFQSHGVRLEDYAGFRAVKFFYPLSFKPLSLLPLFEGDLLIKAHLGAGLVCLLGYRNLLCSGNRLHSVAGLLRKESVHICLSDCFEDISGTGVAFKQLEQLSRQRKLSTDREISHYAELRNIADDGPDFSRELLEIIVGIERSELAPVQRNLDKIYHSFKFGEEVSIAYIEHIYNRMCVHLYEEWRYMRNVEAFSAVLDKLKNAVKIIEDSLTYTDMHFAIKKIVLELYSVHEYNKKRISGKTLYVQKAKEYLEKHLDDSTLTLQLVADKLSISSSYLSTIFKQETGVSFSDNLKKIRIEKSLTILKEDRTNVADVGRRVGFIGEKVFFDVFKKHMGISPAKYRRRIRSEE